MFTFQLVYFIVSTITQENVTAVPSTLSNNNHQLFDENLIVIYNRVPKTGSTSFVNLAYDLCKKNKFHVLHINITANMHVLSLQNQVILLSHSLYFNHITLLCTYMFIFR